MWCLSLWRQVLAITQLVLPMLGHCLNALAHPLWPWPASGRELWTSPHQGCSESLQGFFGSPWWMGGRACPASLVRMNQHAEWCLRTISTRSGLHTLQFLTRSTQMYKRWGVLVVQVRPDNQAPTKAMPSAPSQLTCTLSWLHGRLGPCIGKCSSEQWVWAQSLQGSCRWVSRAPPAGERHRATSRAHVAVPFLTP